MKNNTSYFDMLREINSNFQSVFMYDIAGKIVFICQVLARIDILEISLDDINIKR
jgi:hypothetical protein